MAIRTIPVDVAAHDLHALLADVTAGKGPIRICGERRAAVLISEAEWLGLEETLFLLSVPGMRESIVEGLSTPIEETTATLDW